MGGVGPWFLGSKNLDFVLHIAASAKDLYDFLAFKRLV